MGSEVPVTVKNLKITGGNAENGGGIFSDGELTLSTGCLVNGNTATKGGGVFINCVIFAVQTCLAALVISLSFKFTAEFFFANVLYCHILLYKCSKLSYI